MKWLLALGLVGVFFSLCVLAGVAARTWLQPTADPPAVASSHARGEMLYTLHCAKCHGDEGHGDAEGAEKLIPPPRDFARRPWRFEPTAASIERVIREGIPGTAMPAFGASVPAADIAALTQYVQTLSEADSPTVANDPFTQARFTQLVQPRSAPKLTLESASGTTSLTDLQGKVVVLNFWGTNCEHCLKRMPELAKLQAEFADRDVAILNICADESDVATAQAMLAAAAPELTTYVDPSGLANSRFEVSLMPTFWLVDRQGQLVAKAQGARDWSDPAFARLLEALLTHK